jgi:hypothetical protein
MLNFFVSSTHFTFVIIFIISIYFTLVINIICSLIFSVIIRLVKEFLPFFFCEILRSICFISRPIIQLPVYYILYRVSHSLPNPAFL